MQYLLPIIAMGNFAAGLTSRVIDPVIPQISQQLAVSITTAATLASASAIAFAVIQLPLGMVADLFGKPKVILTCLVILGLANIVGCVHRLVRTLAGDARDLRARRRRCVSDRRWG